MRTGNVSVLLVPPPVPTPGKFAAQGAGTGPDRNKASWLTRSLLSLIIISPVPFFSVPLIGLAILRPGVQLARSIKLPLRNSCRRCHHRSLGRASAPSLADNQPGRLPRGHRERLTSRTERSAWAGGCGAHRGSGADDRDHRYGARTISSGGSEQIRCYAQC
jgi:hypothetical protein